MSPNPYRMIYQPKHARSNTSGLVGEHILVAEKTLSRPLEPHELVHHLDFDKLNNESENLLVMSSRKEHQNLAAAQATFLAQKGLIREFVAWYKERFGLENELVGRLASLEREKAKETKKLKKMEARERVREVMNK